MDCFAVINGVMEIINRFVVVVVVVVIKDVSHTYDYSNAPASNLTYLHKHADYLKLGKFHSLTVLLLRLLSFSSNQQEEESG